MTDKEKQKNLGPLYDATILFADMVDSSMLSHVLEPSKYDSLVSEFQEIAAKVVQETMEDKYFDTCKSHVEASVRGDELCLIIVCMNHREVNHRGPCHPNRCAWTALQIAVRLKRRWLLSKENTGRIERGQPLLSVAIGIHAGPVIVKDHTRLDAGNISLPVITQERHTAEGYAINIAKRVESVSRSGRFSRIFLTRPIYNRTPADFRPAFIRVESPELKGIPIAPIIYEAKGIGHFDDKCFPNSPEFEGEGIKYYKSVLSSNPDEVWLQLDLAHWYFDKGEYNEAANKYKAVLEADPLFAPAYTYLGRAYFRNYRLPEARAALERSLQLDPGQARANHFLAVCLRREALIFLFREQRDLAKDLFKRSIRYHQTACRIADLENMNYPWARNGLIWTVAQSFEVKVDSETLMRPFDLDTALTEIEKLWLDAAKTVREMGKEHLLLHTKAVVLLQMKNYPVALDTIEQSLESLNQRKNQCVGIPPDDKAYSDKCAEILFHRGKCKLLSPDVVDIGAAKRDWQEAKDVLLEPWKLKEEKQRALNGQYWPISPVIMPDGTQKRVRDYFTQTDD